MAEKKRQISELLEQVLRKDPEKTRRGQEVGKFLAERAAERTAKAGESTGVGDILTMLPGYTGLKALKAGQKGLAALDAAQFLNQFNLGKTGSDIDNTLAALYLARGTTGSLKGLGKLFSDLDAGMKFTRDAMIQSGVMGGAGMAARKFLGAGEEPQGESWAEAAFPHFGGVGKIGNLRRAVERMNLKGKDLPMFSYEGLMAPRRQQELERRMKEWIPNLSSKDPQKQLVQLDEWLGPQRKLWGKEPISKGQLLDIMPKELRPAFYQSLKDMGYGGTVTGQREVISQAAKDLERKSGYRVLGSTPGAVRRGEMPSNAARKWEEIMPFEQTGGRPKGWSERFPGREPEWIARPGETLSPGQTPFNWKDAAAGGAAGGLMAIAGLPEDGQDQQAAVPRMVKLQRALAMARDAKAWAPREAPVFRTPEGDFPRFKYGKLLGSRTSVPEVGYSRNENLADVGPAEMQRRGGSYAYGNVDTEGKPQLPGNSSMYHHEFSNILNPTSEGGSRNVRGTLKVTNPLIVPTNSFFGYKAPQLVQGDGPAKNGRWKTLRNKSEILQESRSLKEFNEKLPKNLRINNNEWRNFSNSTDREFYGGSDTIGDLLLTKFARRNGYDAILPANAYFRTAKGKKNWYEEMIMPNESRHQLLTKFTPSIRTLMKAAKNRPDANAKIEMMVARKNAAEQAAEGSIYDKPWTDPVAGKTVPSQATAPSNKNVLDDIMGMIFENKWPKSETTPKKENYMTKEDRIKIFGNPGVKQNGSIYFDENDMAGFKGILPKGSFPGKKSVSNGDYDLDYNSFVKRGKDGKPSMYGNIAIESDLDKFIELSEKYGLKGDNGTYWPSDKPAPTGDLLEKLKSFGVIF